MTQFDRFASVPVWAGDQLLTLGEAVDREPMDLVDPLWGVVAAWDAADRRHIVNWDLGWVLVDPTDDEWPRRQLLFELAAGEPLDLDLIAAAMADQHVAHGDLTRERGGRVRPLDSTTWRAEHGSVHRPVSIATAPAPEDALDLLRESCESARAALRSSLRRVGDDLLDRIADAQWWCPRYDVWSADVLHACGRSSHGRRSMRATTR